MSDFKNRGGFKATRRIKAFLNPDEPAQEAGDAQTIKKLRRQMAGKDEEISRLRASLAKQEEGVEAGNIVWIFGAGRSGSTWLAAMMDEMERQAVWFEPRVGVVFDPHKLDRYKGRHFVLSEHYKKTWLKSIRTFILDGANARFPKMGADDCLMVKEPAGSVGATWIMEAMPESRMILLTRDPRDYAASWLDAHREGGWQKERRKKDWRRDHVLADTDSDAFVRRQAESYVRHVGSAKQAYDAHRGRKTLIRYEDLRADALGTMKRLYSEIEVPVDEERLAHSVGKHSWESIPEEQKGEGKFYRKAKPGGWREDLTPGQARVVEEITAPLLRELYPDGLP